jgi:hypothetical protein
MFQSSLFVNQPIRVALAWGVIILLSPILLGFLAGYFGQKEYIRRFLQSIGLNPIHVVPTAWDYKFSNIRKAGWLLVTLQDGCVVAGLFGSKSFASSEAGERDLYIQEVYKISEEGPWAKIPQNEGIWISVSQIKHIEFWND